MEKSSFVIFYIPLIFAPADGQGSLNLVSIFHNFQIRDDFQIICSTNFVDARRIMVMFLSLALHGIKFLLIADPKGLSVFGIAQLNLSKN